MRARGQDFRHLAARVRVEMHDHDKGGAGLVGERVEQLLQRADTAGRGADADYDRLTIELGSLVPLLVISFSHRWVPFACRSPIGRRWHLAHLSRISARNIRPRLISERMTLARVPTWATLEY